jgi:predicted nucleotide-binding protein
VWGCFFFNRHGTKTRSAPPPGGPPPPPEGTPASRSRAPQLRLHGERRTLHGMRDARRVMVVHGRNREARTAIFLFLRALGLAPIEWEQAVAATGTGSPHNLSAVRAAMDTAQAVLVLLTAEERAGLLSQLADDDDENEIQLRGQPRQNVVLEAGMAMGIDQERTILVELGPIRQASDFAGLNTVRLTNDPTTRAGLRSRLITAGCAVDETSADYLGVGGGGDFEGCVVEPELVEVDPARPSPQGLAELSGGATGVSRDPDHMELFWIGDDHEVHLRWWLRAHGWSNHHSWDEPKATSLAALSSARGEQMLFGISPHGRVWYRTWEPHKDGWPRAGATQWLEGTVSGPLAAASRGPGKIELLAFDAGGTPCHCYLEAGGVWSPWTTVWWHRSRAD